MGHLLHHARLLVLIMTVISGCARSGESPEEVKLNYTQFAEKYAAAWSDQDAAHFSTFYEEDGALQVNDAEPARGREEVADLAQSYMTALPDMVVSLDSLMVVEGKPRFYWTLDATASGPEGTGNRIHISGYEEWTFGESGLIQLSEGHMDSGEYQRQVERGYSPE